MRMRVFVVAVALSAASLAIGFWRGHKVAPPKLGDPAAFAGLVGFDSPLVDLGPHVWDSDVPFDLTFRNASTRTVTISDVSCLFSRAIGVGTVSYPWISVTTVGMVALPWATPRNAPRFPLLWTV